MLVDLADFFDGRFQLLIVGQAIRHMRDLFFAQADVTNASAWIASGEDRYGMTFAALTLGAAGAVSYGALEQGAAKEIGRLRQAGEKPVEFADGLLTIHQC